MERFVCAHAGTHTSRNWFIGIMCMRFKHASCLYVCIYVRTYTYIYVCTYACGKILLVAFFVVTYLHVCLPSYMVLSIFAQLDSGLFLQSQFNGACVGTSFRRSGDLSEEST